MDRKKFFENLRALLLGCVLTLLAAKDAEGFRWVHDGLTMEPTPDALRAFRRSFYEWLYRRSDALSELADAILTADGAAPSPAHLSLQASHRRGWGSLYAALRWGRMDAESLRNLLARHPLVSGGEDEVPVYAVDVSVWPRCDAECSPQRGYYYHPSRHSAGQSPSSPAGLTSSSHNWASCARAGPPRWT